MASHVLITGGAGFIGSHLADELLTRGHRVRVLDNLSVQVHGLEQLRPDYLDPDVELMVGDVRDAEAVRRALDRVDVVFHLAAMVGVGQSMYEIARYTSVNNFGTATVLEAMLNRSIQRLVVASSMSIYGEGVYIGPEGQPAVPVERTREQLERGEWEVRDAAGRMLQPVPTPECKSPSLASIYALSKYDQERMSLIFGQAYSLPTVALRLFNVYGPRQALSNPYTGVLAIFASRLMNGHPPLVFEDGLQQRDFVSVHDVARAMCQAMEAPAGVGQVINVGSGQHYSVMEIAARLARALGKAEMGPCITGQYRAGDIRHCFAAVDRARELLGYQPQVSLDQGLAELTGWLAGQQATDRVAQAHAELASRGLTV